MQGVDYAVRTAVRLGKPLVINLSFGNSYGAHSGRILWKRIWMTWRAWGKQSFAWAAEMKEMWEVYARKR